jgi:hypothetical protein
MLVGSAASYPCSSSCHSPPCSPPSSPAGWDCYDNPCAANPRICQRGSGLGTAGPDTGGPDPLPPDAPSCEEHPKWCRQGEDGTPFYDYCLETPEACVDPCTLPERAKFCSKDGEGNLVYDYCAEFPEACQVRQAVAQPVSLASSSLALVAGWRWERRRWHWLAAAHRLYLPSGVPAAPAPFHPCAASLPVLTPAAQSPCPALPCPALPRPAQFTAYDPCTENPEHCEKVNGELVYNVCLALSEEERAERCTAGKDGRLVDKCLLDPTGPNCMQMLEDGGTVPEEESGGGSSGGGSGGAIGGGGGSDTACPDDGACLPCAVRSGVWVRWGAGRRARQRAAAPAAAALPLLCPPPACSARFACTACRPELPASHLPARPAAYPPARLPAS